MKSSLISYVVTSFAIFARKQHNAPEPVFSEINTKYYFELRIYGKPPEEFKQWLEQHKPQE